MPTLRNEKMEKITVIDYLVKELQKLGVEDFFGLPGDYNFNILDAIIANPETNWIGCTNELNAGYAADGYARINGYGAVVTTFGVGELSAVNAIAGSYAENVPVVKIVGVPATKFIKNNTLLHHNFQNPDYYAFQRVFSNVVCASAFLDFDNAKNEIDRVLTVMLKEQKPVYIAVPMDVCYAEIEDEPQIFAPESDEKSLKEAYEHIIEVLNRAENPIILADGLVERFKAKKEFTEFLKASNYPVTTLLIGKDLVDDDYGRFLGTYQGEDMNKSAYNAIKNADAVVCAGTVMSDLNTIRFSVPVDANKAIDIQGNYTIVENVRYDNVLMKDILKKLARGVKKIDTQMPETGCGYLMERAEADTKLAADNLYPRFQEFLEPYDQIFAETGIIAYAMAPLRLPEGAKLNNQILWGSIGWATPAAMGGAFAGPENRTILITGEGSHQLTAMEISTMMRNGLKPVVFVINNDGYTIERLLSKDPTDCFNDIAQWNYSKLPDVFAGEVWTAQARTVGEFEEVLEQIKTIQKTKMCYVELFVDKMDVCELTRLALKGLNSRNPVKA